ncbi:MAG: cyanoexosortase A system-associated protein [Leptolyngbyaceae cyanobacterium bins.349]|nr:cyanoexosortase A system-associated protein [Leptolyngbyaceae cyanobacterium bins.349]
MLNSNWPKIRLGLLAVTFVGAALTWARVAAMPKIDSASAQKPENTLQASVPIQGWQLIASEPINSHAEARFGRRYQYQKGTVALQAEQFYMQSDGNVSRYLFVHTPIRTANANMKVKFQPGVGHYGVVTHNGKAYLSACVNPRGSSTVTESQFTQNRYAHDLQISRIFPWLLGQESLIDYRCLWTLMSVPLKDNANPGVPLSDDKAYKNLEAAWVSWHQWWQANFPPSL